MRRALYVSPFHQGSHLSIRLRGSYRAGLALCDRLEREGYEVTPLPASIAHDAIGRPWDVVFWNGPLHNEGMLDSINADRSFVWRQGDESILTFAPEALISRPRAWLLVPSSWARSHVAWDVPSRVMFSCLEPVSVSEGPLEKKVLHVQAFASGKGTGRALDVAKALPGVEFVFRRNTVSLHDRLSPVLSDEGSIVTILHPTDSREELWDGIGCVLVTSLSESFCLIAYEALSRGIPVVAPTHLESLFREWSGSAVRTETSTEGMAREVEQALRMNEPRSGLHHLAVEAHERAISQLQCLLEAE